MGEEKNIEVFGFDWLYYSSFLSKVNDNILVDRGRIEESTTKRKMKIKEKEKRDKEEEEKREKKKKKSCVRPEN